VAGAEGLAGLFNIEVTTPGNVAARLQQGRFDLVTASAGAFIALAQALAGGRDRLLLNALGEGVCLTDVDGRIIWSNDRFSTYDEPTRQRIAAACRQAARQLADPGARGGTGTGVVAGGRRFDVSGDGATGGESGAGGAGRILEVAVSPVGEFIDPGTLTTTSAPTSPSTPSPTPRTMVAVVWDVTAARRTQLKAAAIDRAGDELVRLDAELVRTMHTPERIRVLEQKIVKIAHDLLSFDQFNIRLVDPRTGKLELVMSKGLPPEAMEVSLYNRPEGNGISGYVAATGRSYISYDTTTDPRYVSGIADARSSLTVPLRLNDKVIGVFNVESNTPAAFDEEDRQYAEKFANHVALALHILDLLRVERVETSETVGHTVEDELAAPLAELAADVARLKAAAESGAAGGEPGAAAGTAGGMGGQTLRSIDRIIAEVEALKKRVKDVTSGPQTILGADEALSDSTLDPVMAGKRILVADDEGRIRQVIRDVLAARGADVVVCEDATSAIEALRGAAPGGGGGAGRERRPGAADEEPPRGFDVLISDIRMPDKTGYEIFAEARKHYPDLPVILMTGFGYDPHHSIVRASQEGLQCVLFKPFQAERLIEEVHKALTPKPA
ncbi:MAG TPA: GAF domain-containing protein, partial [Phycisphaerales bacterium]|nr:GAF domain-containing protein [Phycisphaerales bacterium]